MVRGLRAPKGGVTVGGVHYKGGRYLPTRPGVSVYWNGDLIVKGTQIAMARRMTAAMNYLKGKIQKNINKKVVRRGGEVQRSQRGEYPRRESGDLRRGISVLVTKVGGNVYGYAAAAAPYGEILEKELERPFASRTFREELPELRAIMGKPL